MKHLINKLRDTQSLTKEEWNCLLTNRTPELAEYLFEQARQVREEHYGKDVYIRGLIEFTNVCKNDCLYCGIRRSNVNASRYRLTIEEILECCDYGYELGFRTFVLQGGEDGYFTQERLVQLIRKIKEKHSDCAVTLSVGEWSKESYERFFEAGAERYLLRHETYDANHYNLLHPAELSGERRRQCLWELKEIGYQTGTGIMVGSPYQTVEHLVQDFLFIKELNPQMVGIGPFIPHTDTPFANEKAGTLELTLYLLGLLRLMLPKVLLPATTALGSIAPDGRELGILAGANVVMPNLSPVCVREKYMLYDKKRNSGDEAAEGLKLLKQKMESIGYQVVVSRGDSLNKGGNENV